MKICRRVWFIGLALLVGCGGKGPSNTVLEETRKVVMLSARGERVFESSQRMLLAQLMVNDPRFELQVLDAGFDAKKQRRQLDEAISQKPFAILLDPLSVPLLKDGVQAAMNSGILMLGLGEDSASLGCTTTLFADQKKLGQMVGELVIHALKAKAVVSGKTEAEGRVVEIRGDEESSVSERRHEGFTSALKAAPGIILIHDAPGDWNLEGGRDRTLDALRLQQSFDIVYAHNDLMALGAADALKDRREDVMIIGTDGFRTSDGGMTLVNEGQIDATVYQPMLVDLALVLLKKKAHEATFQPKPSYEMTIRTILPKDVEDIRRQGLPALPEL